MTPDGRRSLAAGAAAAGLAFLVSPLLAGGAPDVTGPAALPDRLAGYSVLTSDVSDSPPGRAVALFQHGYGVELFDEPQAVVLGWRGDAYRRVDVAEDSAGPETQGDPAPMLLSPDGRLVAVGDHDTDEPSLAVVDLGTGATTRHPLPGGGSIRPVAWSADSRRLAYLTSAPTNPYRGEALDGDLVVLDLASGRADAVPGAEQVVAAAFAPADDRIAVQHSRRGGRALAVVDLADGARRVVSHGPVLAGSAAWSPDGRRLAVVSRGSTWTVSFLDPETGAPTADPALTVGRAVGASAVLGWTAPREVVAFVPSEPGTSAASDTSSDTGWLAVVPLDGGTPRPLTEVGGLDSFGVARWQLAGGALGDLEVRSAPGADRGPWPVPWRAALAGVVGALVALGTRRVLLRRTTPAAPMPEAPTDAGPATRSGAVDDGVPDEARARRR